jgi:hypothetical protein
MTEDAKTGNHKVSYVGAPAIFALDHACQSLTKAFGGFGCYLVGSAITRPDHRDVDVRYILPDEEFGALFPDAHYEHATFQHDVRWLIINMAIADWLKKQSGLTVDFQFQPQTWANKNHKGQRQALGLRYAAKSAVT